MFEKQIDAGAKFLDNAHAGWESKISVETLNLSNCTDCVLGQLVGPDGANAAIAKCGPAARFYGFMIDPREIIFGPPGLYKLLTSEWKAEITRRRNVKKMMSDIIAAVGSEPVIA